MPLTDAQIYALPDSDPRSFYYVPPPGTYQNDAGAVVSKSVPNVPSIPIPTDGPLGQAYAKLAGKVAEVMGNTSLTDVAKTAAGAVANGASRLFFGFNVEDLALISLGLIFITVGLLAFDRTRDIVVGAAKGAASLAE